MSVFCYLLGRLEVAERVVDERVVFFFKFFSESGFLEFNFFVWSRVVGVDRWRDQGVVVG